ALRGRAMVTRAVGERVARVLAHLRIDAGREDVARHVVARALARDLAALTERRGTALDGRALNGGAGVGARQLRRALRQDVVADGRAARAAIGGRGARGGAGL